MSPGTCLFRVRGQGNPHLRRLGEKPSRHSPRIVKSLCTPTESPARRAADTRLAAVLLSTDSPLHFAQLSTAEPLFTSVAVEMAAVPPVSRAARRARSLAPAHMAGEEWDHPSPSLVHTDHGGSARLVPHPGEWPGPRCRRPPRRGGPHSRQSALPSRRSNTRRRLSPAPGPAAPGGPESPPPPVPPVPGPGSGPTISPAGGRR